MIAVLLGANGQLGTDIQAANARRANPVTIRPLKRADIDLEDIDRAGHYLRDLTFDVLINCASYHKTDEVETNAQKAFTINSHLVRRLAEICAERKARLVHFSTDYVFGGQPTGKPLTETDAKAPVNVYGASKGMGEDLALQAIHDILVLRVASLFGIAGSSGKGGNFVETMVRLAREKGSLRVVNDQVMSPTSTADIADALWKLLACGAERGVWHVVNSGQASWHEFATQIIKRVGSTASVLPVSSSDFKTTAARPSYSVLDNSKLQAVIGPMRHWSDALDDYLVAKGYR